MATGVEMDWKDWPVLIYTPPKAESVWGKGEMGGAVTGPNWPSVFGRETDPEPAWAKP